MERFQTLQQAFETLEKKDVAAQIQQFESRADKVEQTEGQIYELPVFSYQRARQKKGKISDVVDKNSTAYFFIDGKIQMAKRYNSPEQFDVIFYQYDSVGNLSRSYRYSSAHVLMNVTDYDYKLNRLENIRLLGRFGARDEALHYSEDGKLDYIIIEQFDDEFNTTAKIKQVFNYDVDGLIDIRNLFDTKEETIYRR